MSKTIKATIEVQGATITVVPHEGHDFISLTDIAKYKNPDHPDDVVRNWLRNRSTVEFLGIWERLNNPDFNPVEFDGIRMQTGINSFVLTPKQWIDKTGAVGIRSSVGRERSALARHRKGKVSTPRPIRRRFSSPTLHTSRPALTAFLTTLAILFCVPLAHVQSRPAA